MKKLAILIFVGVLVVPFNNIAEAAWPSVVAFRDDNGSIACGKNYKGDDARDYPTFCTEEAINALLEREAKKIAEEEAAEKARIAEEQAEKEKIEQIVAERMAKEREQQERQREEYKRQQEAQTEDNREKIAELFAIVLELQKQIVVLLQAQAAGSLR